MSLQHFGSVHKSTPPSNYRRTLPFFPRGLHPGELDEVLLGMLRRCAL
ncbi:hypothetical protein FOPG_06612 [Fusarium oxysporum f. sp. conglutinans race 2 54008]|uniref:Uncharacterized protein n=2 Tax=Fusarium oxysporum TaxID=5507 RepID=X0LGE4_FUSOX|nr:hypothetical protein FOPG_06612 [Fusarium oxysporum f. sp. conglutinans race 2 54008]EXM25024.1 hypothetical protein FOTG_08015 [Fusarium oxysporum f. sp. vasinfectum 25433]